MTKKEIQKILRLHEKWLNGKKGGERADLSGADLFHADLTGANLSYANLMSANLIGANLTEANLTCSLLSKANLWDAVLVHTNLKEASLSFANLKNANLSNANLYYTDLNFTDLENAILTDASLCRTSFAVANLKNANLTGVDLRYTNLTFANLKDAILSPNEEIRKGLILTQKMIGWKKCRKCILVKLEIPKGAIVFSINNQKCRTNKAKVLEVVGAEEGISYYEKNFVYRKGETLTIDNFDLMYNVECGAGIHFFKTKEEAEIYRP